MMIDRARKLRREATPPEALLWSVLRGRRLAGLTFRRQEPIGPFVVDCCCRELRLIVELDGLAAGLPKLTERVIEAQLVIRAETRDDRVEHVRDAELRDEAGAEVGLGLAQRAVAREVLQAVARGAAEQATQDSASTIADRPGSTAGRDRWHAASKPCLRSLLYRANAVARA